MAPVCLTAARERRAVRRSRSGGHAARRQADRRARLARGIRVKVQHMTSRSLVVKLTAGKDDPERCNQAFTVAATAVASGVQVSLWLTGEASWFAVPGRAGDVTLPYAIPLGELLAKILGEGTVTVCTQCAARRGIRPGRARRSSRSRRAQR